MIKYRSITRLLKRLECALAAGRLAVSDRWVDDEKAVGFHKPGAPELAAYVSTHGHPPGRYDLELEFPELEDSPVGAGTAAGSGMDLDGVLGLLEAHFDLTEALPPDQPSD